MASSESGRHWSFGDSDFGFPHRFLSGRSLRIASETFYWHPEIRQALGAKRPDILLVAGAWIHPTVLSAALSPAPARIIFWSESHVQSIRRSGFVTRLARRWVLSQFSEFAVPGELARRYVEQHRSPGVRIFYLPNLVDPSVFHDQVRESRPVANRDPHPNRRVLLIVARLSEEKGLLPFLEGIRRLDSGEKDKLTLLIAGSGRLGLQIEEWISRHDVDVQLLGQQPELQLTGLYALADGFCLPSISDPNPISVIEALWAGLPLLLSSRVGNHPECLRSGMNGFLFDPTNPQSIAQQVSKWLALSRAELATFGESSLQIARTCFDPAAGVTTFLEEVLEASGEGARYLQSAAALG